MSNHYKYCAICEYLWIHELKHEGEPENGYLTLLGDTASFCKNVLHLCYLRGRMCRVS